jgi:molybdopterin/thiamine biosynthesis adenylyltransferase
MSHETTTGTLKKYNVFQRQEELAGWNQGLIENLTCLVLGVGGLGTNISMNLCRLGVKKLILVDMDTVDTHNLNRQILYRAEHVNRSKVECAQEELLRHHRVREDTEIEIHHLDVIKNWQTVLGFVKSVDVIFNTIDYGDYFDLVLCHIALRYSKPVVLGGTEPFYGHTVSYFLQGVRAQMDIKYHECHELKDGKHYLEEIDIEQMDDLSFLPQDVHPSVGGSTVYSAGTCSHLMTSAMINYLLHLREQQRSSASAATSSNQPTKQERPNPPKQMIFNLMTMESFHWFGEDMNQ